MYRLIQKLPAILMVSNLNNIKTDKIKINNIKTDKIKSLCSNLFIKMTNFALIQNTVFVKHFFPILNSVYFIQNLLQFDCVGNKKLIDTLRTVLEPTSTKQQVQGNNRLSLTGFA